VSFLRHEPCPACGSRDNLARYTDGGGYCFGCGRVEKGRGGPPQEKPVKRLPEVVATLPAWAVQELTGRGLTASEMALFSYSPSLDRICYQNGNFMECRSFTAAPKVLTFGEKPFIIFGEGRPVVLVEDIFSAIRVGRVVSCMPLFGSVISPSWMAGISKITKDVTIWLDQDKYPEAVKFSQKFRTMGVRANVVFTQLDPKAYNEDFIKETVL
jgi:hypothetical protein